MSGHNARAIGVLTLAGLIATIGITTSPLPALAQSTAPDAGAECAAVDEAAALKLMDTWSAGVVPGSSDEAVAKLDSIVAPGFISHSPAGDSDYATFKAKRGARYKSLPVVDIKINFSLVDENYGFAHWTQTSKHSGDVEGVSPSGKQVDWDGMAIMRFECGKVAEVWTQFEQDRLDPTDVEVMIAAPVTECKKPIADEGTVEQIARAYNDYGINAGNIDALEEIVHENVTMDPQRYEDVTGFRDMAGSLLLWRYAFPDLRHEIQGDVIVTGPFAAYRWVATGTDKGGLWGEEPTGKKATWEGMTLLEVRCGEVVRVWVESDTGGLRDQLHGS